MFQNFEQFLATSSAQIPVLWFIINFLIAAILALILKKLYIKFGTSLSNRRSFGNNFLIMTLTTMLIITIVKSSLALSLGLVGALSIIRFRAAIKEPEELSFLFLAISIGLGLGADQSLITILAFILISVIIIVTRKTTISFNGYEDVNIIINSSNQEKIDLEIILEILDKYCSTVNLKRLDETKEFIEVLFIAEFEHYKNLIKAKNDLRKIDENIKINFLENLPSL